jgi:glycosyltransferase involved in cell wall biosynthesis
MIRRQHNEEDCLDVVFVSPGPLAQGGISKVVENFKAGFFWKKYKCIHFGTSKDSSVSVVKLIYAIWRQLCFFYLILRKNLRLVSVHASSDSSFYRKAGYILLSRIFGIPIIIHIHPSHFHDFYVGLDPGKRRLIDFILHLSNELVFLTQEMADKFGEIYPQKMIRVLVNPVNTSLYETVLRPEMSGNRKLLFLGWIIAGKGVYDIVDIIPDIVGEFPDTTFLFAGNKEVEKLQTLIRDRQLEKNAKVLGWVEGEEKIALLRTSRFLLLPTYTEGIPNVLLEAMASGLPVITTPVGGIPTVFMEGVNGYYVTPGDKEGLRDVSLRLLRDDEECMRLSEETLQSAKVKFDVDIVSKKLEEIYLPYITGLPVSDQK